MLGTKEKGRAMKKRLYGLAIGIALASAFVIGGCSCSAAPDAGGETGIIVSASSETWVVPDKAQISIAVQSQGISAEECQKENARDVNAVIEALRTAGISEENIKTEWTNLTPIQDYSADRASSGDDKATTNETMPVGVVDEANSDAYTTRNDASSSIASEEAATDEKLETTEAAIDAHDEGYSTIIGYEMYTSLSVKGLDIDAVSAITSAAVAAGATDVSGIQYYASGYDEAYGAALDDAIAQAQQKAQRIADASGVRLGGIVAVTEGYQNTGYRYANSMMAEAEADGAYMEVMPGEININAQVTVRFTIA